MQSKLESGAVNLMQVAMVQQACRQAKRTISVEETRELIDQIQGRDLQNLQILVARALDLPIVGHEKKRVQRDESVRMELTFSKEQMEILNRFKDAVSHQLVGASWADVLTKAAQIATDAKAGSMSRAKPRTTSKVEVATRHPRYIARDVRREVSERDQACQWRDPSSGKICGSSFQLQVDHKLSVCRGGRGEIHNLQRLCSVHNRLKYEYEQRGWG